MRASERMVSKASTFTAETATTKVQRYKSPNVYQIPVELIKSREEHCFPRSLNILILFRGSVAGEGGGGGILYKVSRVFVPKY